ncbi:MAG: hypothetical protein ACRCX2_39000 [Paraclostridium sp.]
MRSRLIYGSSKDGAIDTSIRDNVCVIKVQMQRLILDTKHPKFNNIEDVSLDDKYWESKIHEFYVSGYDKDSYEQESIIHKQGRRFISDSISDRRLIENNKYQYENSIKSLTNDVLETLGDPESFESDSVLTFDISNKTNSDCDGEENTRVYAKVSFDNLSMLSGKTELLNQEMLNSLDMSIKFTILDPSKYTLMKIKVYSWRDTDDQYDDDEFENLGIEDCTDESLNELYIRNYKCGDFIGANTETVAIEQFIIDSIETCATLDTNIYYSKNNLVEKCCNALSGISKYTEGNKLKMAESGDDQTMWGCVKYRIEVEVTFENLDLLTRE